MLRLFQEKDLPQLLLIEELTQTSPWTAETFARCWEMGYLGWVIEQDKVVIGFIIVSTHSGESHILNLCVHPDFQHQGFGRKLLQYVFQAMKLKGTGMIFLEVRRGNSKAIALYHQLDFVQIGERKNYYPTPKGREDALVFAKDLRVE